MDAHGAWTVNFLPARSDGLSYECATQARRYAQHAEVHVEGRSDDQQAEGIRGSIDGRPRTSRSSWNVAIVTADIGQWVQHMDARSGIVAELREPVEEQNGVMHERSDMSP
jgi:hypothetical protein